jgi:hypothetical protein
MKKLNSLVPTLLAAALVAAPVAAFAQSSDEATASDATSPTLSDIVQPVEVTGTVAEVDGGVVLLQSGQSIYLTNDTQIKDDAALGGAQITATGFQNLQDGSVEATLIEVK